MPADIPDATGGYDFGRATAQANLADLGGNLIGQPLAVGREHGGTPIGTSKDKRRRKAPQVPDKHSVIGSASLRDVGHSITIT